MKKKDAVKMFKEECKGLIEKGNLHDISMFWNIHLDKLVSDGSITSKQYETWVEPKW